ncbi:hypothetical protein EMCG_08731 [[Emmonsia] crescens]|uniref:Uncharacterized protein n=1 Tax=[Emmonsia] crescens TaxID=73230 RepID=A0A0G2JAB5_9EURO|nr:hypothetical protein EMCG_08731 [Emmonsia crescens UAMH 3008]
MSGEHKRQSRGALSPINESFTLSNIPQYSLYSLLIIACLTQAQVPLATKSTIHNALESRSRRTCKHCSLDKLLKVLPDNARTKSNVIKTKNLRVDVHQNSKNPNLAVAKIQANAQADDNSVKNFINSGNKGDGGHKGTHKNIIEIPFDRTSFDVNDFVGKIEKAR